MAAGLVNTAPPGPGRTVGQILRANVLTRFNAILGTLFVVVLVVGPLQDALFGIVLVVNTGFGAVQQLRAKHTLDRLAILTAARARVIREDVTAEIPVDRLVLDDVLELRQGDQVPADGEVLRAHGLEVDEALLTGEALIAGLSALLRIALITAMAGALVLLLAVPLARQVFALQLPPASVCAWATFAAAAAIAGLTLWTRWRSGHAATASVLSPSDR